MERRAHWLRQNAADRIPRRVIVFDTESYEEKSVKGSEHEFRCAVASFETLTVDGKPTGDTTWLKTESALEFWYFVTSFTNAQHRTVAFAHNLSFDLRLSSGLIHLPKLGYECTGIALTSYSCWARFRNGTKSLWLCDSLSFVPKSLETIGTLVQLEKPTLPEPTATQNEWLERCEADTRITREAILRVIRYIKQNDLGDFRLTGSAQCSAAFRHRFLPAKTLLVHDNEEALAKERKAAWSGRAEVWTHGEVSKPVYELDYEYAYARLAYDLSVPVKILAEHSGIPWQRMETVMNHYAVVADVKITTETPCVPAEKDGGIVWPVGEFQTTLWDKELRLAHSEGALIEVERYWFYKKQPILRGWAQWILDTLSLGADKLDPVVRIMLKDWSRALIGRFGLRYSIMDEIGSLPTNDLRLFGVADIDEDKELEYLQLGKQLFERMAREEAPSSTPMVMSYIMSAARVKLWEAMKVAGFNNLLYIDTDGFLTTRAGRDRINRAVSRGNLGGMRTKAKYNGGNFRAPRNIDLGEMRRVSGAPRKAERLAPGIYRGEVWESLPTALRRGHIGNVFVHERTFTVSDTDKRRVHLENGKTAPHRLECKIAADVAESA